MQTAAAIQNLIRYDLNDQQPIGRGGCGVVWKARDLLFDRDVALKTIRDEIVWDAPDAAQRSFRKEAAAGARLGEHTRHVVRVFDFGRTNDILYLAMEWLAPSPNTHSIDVASRCGRSTLSEVKKIIFEAAEAIAVAHLAGVVHSDIAPGNIVYDATNNIYKLADFGLLKVLEERMLSFGSGSLLVGGRRAFQPSAVLADFSKIGRASDIYALAVTLRVLLEGQISISKGTALPTPAVVQIPHEQRAAPDECHRRSSWEPLSTESPEPGSRDNQTRTSSSLILTRMSVRVSTS